MCRLVTAAAQDEQGHLQPLWRLHIFRLPLSTDGSRPHLSTARNAVQPLLKKANQLMGRPQPDSRACCAIFRADENGEPVRIQYAEGIFICEIVAEIGDLRLVF